MEQCVGWLVKCVCSGLKEIQSIFLGTTIRVLWDELERIQKKVKRVFWGTWSAEVWMVLGVCSRGEWRKIRIEMPGKALLFDTYLCAGDSEGGEMAKMFLPGCWEKPWEKITWRDCEVSVSKVLRRRLGKAFSETTTAVDSASEQMNWQEDFVRVPSNLALRRQDQNEHWATTCALSCKSSNWLHWSFYFITAQ